ncbi:MAG: hypothetical protein HY908_17315 [Myxococcales bacterium]|nr:hypothetical protein [Myxococcales bacterium]
MDRWELAARLAAGPLLAAAVVADDASVGDVAIKLDADLRLLGARDVRLVSTSSARELEDAVAAEPATSLVVHGFGAFAPNEWARLDRARTRLAHGDRAVLFVLHPAELKALLRFAPNLASWLATETHHVVNSDALTADEREARLMRLREKHGLCDEEAVRYVEQRTEQALDPDFGEWMVLLGRGDLLRGKAVARDG